MSDKYICTDKVAEKIIKRSLKGLENKLERNTMKKRLDHDAKIIINNLGLLRHKLSFISPIDKARAKATIANLEARLEEVTKTREQLDEFIKS